MEKDLKEKQIAFEKEEKEKDRKLTEKKEKLSLAIAGINSGRSIEDIEKISKLLGLN